ncbi:MAG TPA: hypothetical protein VNO30_03400 [Kofleriaceae bacterium]|nr:hypothetical protein [Kofleriaceae bacterium]
MRAADHALAAALATGHALAAAGPVVLGAALDAFAAARPVQRS